MERVNGAPEKGSGSARCGRILCICGAVAEALRRSYPLRSLSGGVSKSRCAGNRNILFPDGRQVDFMPVCQAHKQSTLSISLYENR